MFFFFRVKEKNDKEILQLVNGPTKFTAGEEVTIEWEVERQPITFKGTKQYPIRVKRNGKLVSDCSKWNTLFYLPAPKYGTVCKVLLLYKVLLNGANLTMLIWLPYWKDKKLNNCKLINWVILLDMFWIDVTCSFAFWHWNDITVAN